MRRHPSNDPPYYLTPAWHQADKNRLMNLKKILWHLFLIAVFTLLSYLLTRSIAVGNFLGIVLSIISLAATITFLYLLPKLYEQPASEEETA